jgi:hypothetical protein
MGLGTSAVYLWVFLRYQVLDHQFHLSVFPVRHGTAGIAFVRSGYAADFVTAGGSAMHLYHFAVSAAGSSAEQTVTLDTQNFFGCFAERLQGCTVHPYDGVLGIVDYDQVVYLIQNHVQQDAFEIVLLHFLHRFRHGITVIKNT